MSQRLYNSPWKASPETNRRYAARTARAQERDEYTPPGTKPNPTDPEKVARKRKARANPTTPETTRHSTEWPVVSGAVPQTGAHQRGTG